MLLARYRTLIAVCALTACGSDDGGPREVRRVDGLTVGGELGFTGEALLVDHIRDRNGELRDLMVLAHHVRDTWAGMDTVGVADELGSTAG